MYVTANTLIIIAIFSFISTYYGYLMRNTHETYIYAKRDWIRGNLPSSEIQRNHNITILAFGDSQTASSFLPKEFDLLGNNKTYTLNLSLVSHDITRYYFMLKEFIEKNYIPDYIILNPSNQRENVYALNGSIEEVLFYFASSEHFQFSILVDYLFPWLNKNKVNTAVTNIFQDIDLTRSKSNKQIKEMIQERGTFYWIPKSTSLGSNFKDYTDHPNKKVKFPRIDGRYMKDIYRFLDLTKEMNIKVLIIGPPLRIGSRKKLVNKPVFYTTIEKKYDNVVISNSWNDYWYDSIYFMARGHMNYFGAKKFTHVIYSDFNKAFLLK